MASTAPAARRPGKQIHVRGVVQGVGFRPFVYRLARSLDLSGSVANRTDGVMITVAGSEAAVECFVARLRSNAPPAAAISDIETRPAADVAPGGFRIEASAVEHAQMCASPIGPDLATCAQCRAEIFDARDRRRAYAFTNCIQCGPRYSIALAAPYDRLRTTMSEFEMCDGCRREFDDPADRRFHAQPNACPSCGPVLTIMQPDGSGAVADAGALDAACELLVSGHVLAVKGIGGFHLGVDACDPKAVAKLRGRKRRPAKPFAVMVPDLETARRVCDLDEHGERILTSAPAPILVAPRRPGSGIADEVAPGLGDVGVFLPYTPLHHLLLARVGRPIVLTSGNRAGAAIVFENADAVETLGPLVDAILTHNRPISMRCDDSVVREAGGRSITIRRSRGIAPRPIRLPVRAARPILAVGGQLKNTVALAAGGQVTPSHHIGDIETVDSHRAFLDAIDHLRELCGTDPEIVAHDLHPEYMSTKFAHDLDLPGVAVQHHHGHIASCLVEHGREQPVLGVAFDGHGYGPDATLWGGEFLIADLQGYRRLGALRPVGLPGGPAAIREPWRMTLAWLAETLGPVAASEFAGDDPSADGVAGLLADAVRTTSAGRLFDAVAALVGLRREVSFEGQAAAELETLARNGTHPVEAPCRVYHDGPITRLDPADLLDALFDARTRGVDIADLALGFHHSFATGTARLAADLAREHDLSAVALTGGVFQNILFHEIVSQGLQDLGMEVLAHSEIPPNDGGLSIGQAAVAAARSGVSS